MNPKFKVGDRVVYTGWGDIIRTTLKIGWVIDGVNWRLYQLVTDDGVSVGYADERELETAE